MCQLSSKCHTTQQDIGPAPLLMIEGNNEHFLYLKSKPNEQNKFPCIVNICLIYFYAVCVCVYQGTTYVGHVDLNSGSSWDHILNGGSTLHYHLKNFNVPRGLLFHLLPSMGTVHMYTCSTQKYMQTLTHKTKIRKKFKF